MGYFKSTVSALCAISLSGCADTFPTFGNGSLTGAFAPHVHGDQIPIAAVVNTVKCELSDFFSRKLSEDDYGGFALDPEGIASITLDVKSTADGNIGAKYLDPKNIPLLATTLSVGDLTTKNPLIPTDVNTFPSATLDTQGFIQASIEFGMKQDGTQVSYGLSGSQHYEKFRSFCKKFWTPSWDGKDGAAFADGSPRPDGKTTTEASAKPGVNHNDLADYLERRYKSLELHSWLEAFFKQMHDGANTLDDKRYAEGPRVRLSKITLTTSFEVVTTVNSGLVNVIKIVATASPAAGPQFGLKFDTVQSIKIVLQGKCKDTVKTEATATSKLGPNPSDKQKAEAAAKDAAAAAKANTCPTTSGSTDPTKKA